MSLRIEKTADKDSKWNITWKINDVLSLPRSKDFSLSSPSFAIADAIWCLKMTPLEDDDDEDEDYIAFSFVRLESHFSEHTVYFNMTIRDQGKMKDHHEITDHITFSEDHNSVSLESSDFVGVRYYRLENDPDLEYLRDGALEIFFTLHSITGNHKRDKVDISSQTHNFEPGRSHVKLIENLKSLVLSETDSDVTIRVKKREFPAHKAIIGVRSPVFAAMLKSEMKEKSSGVVDIGDLDPDAFPDFLSFLYTGCLNELSVKNVFGLYKVSDMYDVEELKSICVQFMKDSLSVNTFCDVVSISLLHNEKELLGETVDYLAKHMIEILETVEWQAFLHKNLTQGNELLIKALKKTELPNFSKR